MRKIILAIVGCVAALALLGVVVWSGKSHPQPAQSLTFETLKFDFGRARSGTTVHHDFELRNHGSVPLVLDGVTSNCGCTVPGNTPQEIPPNSSATLPVDVHLTGSGLFESKVVVVYRDGSWVTAVLDGECVLQVPAQLAFSDVRQGQASEQRFVVYPFSTRPLHVKSLKWDGQGFEASVAPAASTTQPGNPEIIVRLLPNAPTGEIASTLRIETDDDQEPVKLVVLHANVVAAPPPAQ